MGALGDLLEAMHDAPRAASLHATARQGQDHEKMREAIERRNQSGGGHVTQLIAISPEGATIPSGLQASSVEFWHSSVGWRVDHAPSRTIAANGRVLRFHPGMGGVLTDIGDVPAPFDGLAMYVTPLQWLGGVRFRIVGDELQAQRLCWRVMTNPIEGQQRSPMPMFYPGALDFELWIDKATGIVVRAEGRLDGEVASQFVVDELDVDTPIDPDVFALVTPDGSPIRTQGEMQLDHLRARGVDVSGIDPHDPVAIQEALQTNVGALHQTPDVESLAAQYTPTGPPPDDEDDALIDVGAAFEGMSVLSDDGTELINIEGGENLGTCAAEVRRRFPQQTARSEVKIERIKFLHEREAVVWFRSPYLGTREGRALRIDGRWKVSRATYCGLIAMAGVRCPPPPEAH
jgi:hypothetical protein